MISQILGYGATLSSVIGFQLKKQWQIVLSQLISNFLVALSYILLGKEQMIGGIVCFVGAAQTFVNFLYFKKGKTPSKLSVVIFLIAYALASFIPMAMAGNPQFPYDFLPFLGSLAFLFAISTDKPSATRWLFVINVAVWICYDVMSKPLATANLVTHLVIMGSLILGILRYDIFKKLIEKKVAGINRDKN